MDCPVCHSKIIDENKCTVCGYDKSTDYECYMTLMPLEGAVRARSGRLAALSPEDRPFSCPDCGGVSFQIYPETGMVMCGNCYKKRPLTECAKTQASSVPENQTSSLPWETVTSCPELTSGLWMAPQEVLEEIRKKLPRGVLAVSYTSSAAVTAEGRVLTAGRMENCTLSWPDVTSVAFGWDTHIVGLKFDGTVIASGEYEKIYEGVSDWKDIKMVAAGWWHTVGLMKTGRVVATGHNSQKQCNVESWRNVVYLAANWYTTAGVTADGRVLLTGRLGDICPWEDIVSVALGESVLVGLKKDGRVLVQTEKGQKFPEVSQWENIVAVAAGASHVLGLKADGTVVAACIGWKGRECDVQDWRDIVAIAAGSLSSYGIRKDGTLVACGVANGMDVRENKMLLAWKGLVTEAVTVKAPTEAKNPERQSERYMALAKASLDANKKKQAYEWYVKAAELGNLDGQYNAGMCCMLGLGTEENPDKARMWLRKSAMQGNTMAQWTLTKYFQ